MPGPVVVPTGADLVRTFAHDHPRRAICPRCEQACCRVGLGQLAHTFESCRCTRTDYPHLMEQIWHRTCLVTSEVSGQS